jgi:hypothetical protein
VAPNNTQLAQDARPFVSSVVTVFNLPSSPIMMAFNFIRAGRYINPGRADPRDCRATMPIYNPEKDYKYTIRVGDAHAVFISTGISVKSHLSEAVKTGSAAKAPMKKFLTVRPHSQEAERTIAFFGTILHKSELYVQVESDAISYSTRSSEFSASSELLDELLHWSDSFSTAKATSSNADTITSRQSPAKAPQMKVTPAALDYDAFSATIYFFCSYLYSS